MPVKSAEVTKPAKTKLVVLAKPQKEPKNQAVPSGNRHYVLDTNVLLHDPTAIFRFEEHDIYLPIVVLEELDRHKKGITDLARNARQVTRLLSQLLQAGSMQKGFPLNEASGGLASGRLFIRSGDTPDKTPTVSLDQSVADNQILACAMGLRAAGASTILVTKDINLRVKAMACDVPAQDYLNDKVFSDSDILPSGFKLIDSGFWDDHTPVTDPAFWRAEARQYARIGLVLPVNSFLLEDRGRGERSRIWRVERNTKAESVVYTVSSTPIVHVGPRTALSARNDEQAMSLNLLNDPDVDLVSMLGPAGTGKTLLAVAAGWAQVHQGLYQEVLVTRATVPLGDDIGFLPGTEAEKMDAWLGGTLRDVYSALNLDDTRSGPKVEIASMSFMRGRSFQNKFIIIDEAQNLTIRQIRALLTRAGEGSKVVLTGNISQIDSPYLDEGSSGLAWAAKNLQNWDHAGHVILTRGERSRLSAYVEEISGKNGGAE